jgi:zinc transport system substrate-binding protein
VRGALLRCGVAGWVALIAIVLTAAGWASGEEPLVVYTVNYPLAYFAERIGGIEVQVEFPLPRDVDPAFYRPDAAGVQRYQQADLVLRNGAGYARWIERVSLSRRRTVDTSRGFRQRYIAIEGAAAHSHSSSNQHSHTGTAFVTWLDLDQAKAQARAIADAFAIARPASRDSFEAGFAQLAADLDSLAALLREAFAPLVGQPLLASHPIYQYLARAQGFDLESVAWEPDQLPDASAWQDFSRLHESHTARFMLWEAAPLAETAERLRGLGIDVIVFDPCPNRPASGDFLSAMRENLEAVRTALRER